MEDFVYLCKLFGGLNELVQHGGGNISIKNDSEFIIKSSGFALSEVNKDIGYVIMDLGKLKQINFLDNNEPDLKNMIIKNINPSIETYFHIFLKKYVVHLHPTLINIELCKKNPIINIDEEYIFIDYIKPGYDLSREIFKQYKNERLIFLKNHGIIFSADTLQEIKELIIKTFASFNINDPFLDIKNYIDLYDNICKNNEILFKVPYEYNKILGCFPDLYIKSYTPDIIVYLGSKINNDSVLYIDNGNIYIKSDTKYKCYKILEVLESYYYLYINNSISIKEKEINDVKNWDKEIFRQNI